LKRLADRISRLEAGHAAFQSVDAPDDALEKLAALLEPLVAAELEKGVAGFSLDATPAENVARAFAMGECEIAIAMLTNLCRLNTLGRMERHEAVLRAAEAQRAGDPKAAERVIESALRDGGDRRFPNL